MGTRLPGAWGTTATVAKHIGTMNAIRWSADIPVGPMSPSPKSDRNVGAPRASCGGRGIPNLLVWILAVGMVVLAGCQREGGDLRQRESAAKALFERTAKAFHLPSASATGAEQKRLEAEAVRGYEQVLRQFPEQEYWCAEALRSLGNIRAVQGNTTAALECWSQVTARYPQQDWEVLMALKSSADLLWEANRRAEAKAFYQRIMAQFDLTNASPVVQTVVRGSKLKLEQ